MSTELALGKEVPVGSIDGELKRLWDADDASTNASLINLVIYSEQPGSLAAMSDAARELTLEQACRAILVEIDRTVEKPSIRSWITAHCNLFQGKKSVCSEQVAFKMTGLVSGRLSNTVFAHLNSDLPLILWWQGEFTHVLNQRLVSVVDRLLIDSSDFADPLVSHTLVGDLYEATSGRFVLQDLAWTRTYQFRLGIAQMFDQPAAQAALGSISTVKIETHTDHSLSGLLALAWISTQAGWQIRSKRDGTYKFKNAAGKPITAQIATSDEAAPLSAISFESESMSLNLERKQGDSIIQMSLRSGAIEIDQPIPADADTASQLVASQLSRGGKNRLYRKTLPLFLELLKA